MVRLSAFRTRTLLLLLALGLLAAAAGGSTVPPAAAWRADLAHLATELPQRHADAFFHVSEDEFRSAVEALDHDIPSLTDHEIIVRMLGLVAMVGDAHTTLSGYSFRRFPVSVYWFSDGLHVVRATEEEKDLIGARLIGIDGRSIDDVARMLSVVIPHENEQWLKARLPSFLIAPEILHALGLTGDLDRSSWVFVKRSGDPVERTFTPLSSEWSGDWVELAETAKPLYRQRRTEYYWYEYLPSTRTVYLKYNVCRDDPAKPFSQVGQELAALVQDEPVVKLILDMRDNGGGNSSVLQPLITGIQSMPQFNRPDRFLVVVGRATFSSALKNAIQLRQQTNATFVGEPTGGKPNSYGEVLSFLLPNSGLRVSYSIKYFDIIPGEDPPSFEPDVEIPISSEHFFTGRDPVMEWILRHPRQRAVQRRD